MKKILKKAADPIGLIFFSILSERVEILKELKRIKVLQKIKSNEIERFWHFL